MNNLLIIGARGWGREVYNFLPGCIGYETDFIVKGFLDDKADALEGMLGYPPIIDSVEHYQIQPNDVFVCALGDNGWRRHYADIIIKKGGGFINLIHKEAFIGQNTNLGKGCVVGHGVSISCDVTIGNFVNFQRLVDIGHDAQIGDFCSLGNKSFMGGGAILGDGTIVQTGAIVLPHIHVGRNCTVGAGAVVIKKVKDGETVFGNPAKILKF